MLSSVDIEKLRVAAVGDTVQTSDWRVVVRTNGEIVGKDYVLLSLIFGRRVSECTGCALFWRCSRRGCRACVGWCRADRKTVYFEKVDD